MIVTPEQHRRDINSRERKPKHFHHVMGTGESMIKGNFALWEIAAALGLKPISGGTLEVPAASEKHILKFITNNATPETLKLKLFVNNHTPVDGDALNASDYTEMSTLGYAAVSLTAGNWTFTGTAPSVAAYPQVTYTFTSGTLVNVYGYYVVMTTAGNLIWAERFSGAPFPVQNTGDAILITPQLTATG